MSKLNYVPPDFISDTISYAEYKRKLQRWSRITNVDKKQQAEVVVYHLEGHSSRIQEKIDAQLGDQLIDNNDGMDKLIAYLDTIYAEDEMAEAWARYKKIISLKKNEDQSVSEFIADFEKEYAMAKEYGCELSDTVLAFCLLEACKLSDTDEKFILTAVDFKKGKESKDMLEQVKNSLRKFQSRNKLTGEDKESDSKIKVESLVSNLKEIMLSEGWTPPQSSGSFRNSSYYKGKKNPLGEDGKPLRCFNCQSEYHMMNNCDKVAHKKEKKKGRKKTSDTEAATMVSFLVKKKSQDYELAMVSEVLSDVTDEFVFVAQEEDELCLLLEEAGSRGVLDSACSKTVAGASWIAKYTSTLPKEVSSSLELHGSEKVYQFGGGGKRKSKGCVHLPTVVGDKKIILSVEVVDASIPLLIGSNSMETSKAMLNFGQLKATFFAQEVDMIKIGTGHFCINLASDNVDTHINDLLERDSCVHNVMAALLAEKELNSKQLKRLHHLYGHVSADKLRSFLKRSGIHSAKLSKTLESIAKICEACNRSRKRVPRPKFSMPRVSQPNEIVTMDLKEYDLNSPKRKYICYFIDMFSRFTMAEFIPDKKADTIVNLLMNLWVRSNGMMEGLHSDIGGEMSNEILEDVAANLGVKVTTTSSYSPHQNGINEKNHGTVDLMVTRMLASDSNLSPEMALCWGLHAKNSLENHLGYSPFQLHIGRNPIMPSATRDGPASMEGVTKSQSFANHLTAMHKAREEFIAAESSSSLRKALKSKVYPRGEDIQEGDWVYYKKDDNRSKNRLWRGPSQVSSANGKKLFIDQGARLGTVNRDDAVRMGEEFWRYDQVSEDDNDGNDLEHIKKVSKGDGKMLPIMETSESSSESEESSDESSSVQSNNSDLESDEDTEIEVQDVENESNNSDLESDEDTETEVQDVENERYRFDDIRKDDVIKFRMPGSEFETAKVLSRAGKSKGGNRHWWNIKDCETGECKSINAGKLADIQKVVDLEEEGDTEQSLVVLIPRYMHNTQACIEAKEQELNSWDKFEVYEEVSDNGQRLLHTNWILVQKDEGVKARLCIRGDQEEEKDSIRTDSPTVHKTSVKLFYLLAAQNNWKIGTVDVKSAFLQGADIDRDAFVLPPKERRIPGIVWKMIKRTYGFVDASRGFYLELEKTLLQLGCVVSMYDPAMYMLYRDDGKLGGLILTHVDDLLHGSGDEEFEKSVMIPLRERFLFGKEEDSVFKYTGMQVVKNGDFIFIDQDHYIESLEIPSIHDISDLNCDDLLDEEYQHKFRSITGQIGWIANTSRPDLCYDKIILSTKVGKATVKDFKQAIKMMRKIKSESTVMKFPNLGPVDEWTLTGYGDAGYKSFPDKISSCEGQLVMVSNKRKQSD